MSRRRDRDHAPAPQAPVARALAASAPNADGTHDVVVELLAPAHAAPEAAPRPPRLGATVLWQVPEEWRRWDVAECLGAEVPAVVARVRADGSLDLHPLPPAGAPALRAELTQAVAPWRVRRPED